MTIGDGSLTLRQSPGPRRRSSATGRWEATRNRTNARACKRFDRALREAVRVNACIVSRPNNDVTMAAPISLVLVKFLEHRADVGLSMDHKACQTDWLRGLSAAKDAGLVEEIVNDKVVYLRPAWAPTNAKKK
ncbi:hypothetical protein [Methylocella sp.]|jgi:hypothetical protein|uniref:hypothetical protein n=1 Tax=Methylocella sp. TaxID=1978226 RepID=UPI003C287361